MTAEPIPQPDPFGQSGVNSRLTPKRHRCVCRVCGPKPPKRVKENPEITKGLTAQIRQCEVRIGGQGDLEGLADYDAAVKEAERVRAAIVHRLREQDFPWSEIGRVLGITKQAAQQRYGRGAS